MQIARTVAIILLVGGMAFAFQVPEDPVLKARTQRPRLKASPTATAPGAQTITEPPPLRPLKQTIKTRARAGVTSAPFGPCDKGPPRHEKQGPCDGCNIEEEASLMRYEYQVIKCASGSMMRIGLLTRRRRSRHERRDPRSGKAG